MRWRRLHTPRATAGFSLLEVVIAMGILGLGLLAIAAAQLGALHLSARSRILTTAMLLAQQKMEEFHALPAAQLPASGNDANNPIDIDPADDDYTQFNRRWTIQSNTPVTNIATLTVSVDWVEPQTGTTRTTTIQSMKAQ